MTPVLFSVTRAGGRAQYKHLTGGNAGSGDARNVGLYHAYGAFQANHWFAAVVVIVLVLLIPGFFQTKKRR